MNALGKQFRSLVLNKVGKRNALLCTPFLGLGRNFSSSPSSKTDCYVWGENNGALGLGDKASRLLPTLLESPEPGSFIKHVACGKTHTLLITDSGNLYISGKDSKQKLEFYTFQLVDGISDVVSASGGLHHSVAVTENGEVYTWGYGGKFLFEQGGLGHGNKTFQPSPKLVDPGKLAGGKVVSVGAGKNYTITLSEDGVANVWGDGEYGRLGLGSASAKNTPQELFTFADMDVKTVATGPTHTAAIVEDRMFVWGQNNNGQLGTGPSLNMDLYNQESLPVFIEELSEKKPTGVSCSERHTVVCTESGELYFWGNRQWMSPHKVEFGKKVMQVAAGDRFSLCLTEDHELYSWGSGTSQCLGHGHKTDYIQPSKIEAFEDLDVQSIMCGGKHAVALVRS